MFCAEVGCGNLTEVNLGIGHDFSICDPGKRNLMFEMFGRYNNSEDVTVIFTDVSVRNYSETGTV